MVGRGSGDFYTRRLPAWTPWTVGCLLLALLLGCGGGGGGGGLGLNSTAAFWWWTYADTDLQMSEFWEQDFTLTARFLVQYPWSYVGPILAASSGGSVLAKADDGYHLILRAGSNTYVYCQQALQSGTWHHVAILRLSGLIFLYVDGQVVCPDDSGGCVAYPGPADGFLRFGRTAGGPFFGGIESQFYGFLDDVAVFDTALSQSQIQALANTARLDGSEPGLLAGYTFDAETPSQQALPPVLSRPVTYSRVTPTGSTQSPHPFGALVSQARDSTLDRKLLPTPDSQVALTLPFPSGQAWTVSQGWQGSVSHHGRAAFAWDFVRAGPPGTVTAGAPFYAAAPGEVEELVDDQTSCSGWPANHVDVEHAPDEYGVYLHHVQYSAEVTVGLNVGTGTHLADTGDTGNSGCSNFHLHFALHNLPESHAGQLETFPATFEDYEVSTNGGQTWSKVIRGIPKQGEWIRNP